LTLELALVRACLPDTDPTPSGLVARLERLERLANLAPGAAVPAASAAASAPAPLAPADDVGEVATPVEAPPEAPPAPSEVPPVVAAGPSTQLPVPHAADAGSVDVVMLRRSWGAVIDHLGQLCQPILRAILESATVSSYDGATLELAFPPDKKTLVAKVHDRQDVLQQALADLFGVTPAVTCVVRESREPVGGPAAVEIVDEEEAPDEAEALRRVQEMLGATPVDGAGD
jgi:DNA polymerase-3 subunit gamma/tau